jgi:hypothetical protein
MIPIFKKGDKSDVSNYRSVAIQNSMAKLFDLVVFEVVRNELRHQLCIQQHGFVSKKSTVTNLLSYASELSRSIEKGDEVDSVYTDFSKAFDKVSHQVIMEKLIDIGFGGSLLKWLQSYIVGRKYSVRFGNANSSKLSATSGVPAGTHGGPDLFLVMINDLADILHHSKISMYADDCKIFKEIHSEEDRIMLQGDVNRFNEWCEINKLAMNVDKCVSITFSRKFKSTSREYSLNGKTLMQVDSVRDLGVDFEAGLSFSKHISKSISSALRVLGFIRRFSQDFRDPMILKILYCSLVRPHLEYGSIVWSPRSAKDVNRIEAVQRKFTKIICFRLIPQRNLSYFDRCAYLGLETLEKRRAIMSQVFVSNVINGKINSSEILQEMQFKVPRMSSRFWQPKPNIKNKERI